MTRIHPKAAFWGRFICFLRVGTDVANVSLILSEQALFEGGAMEKYEIATFEKEVSACANLEELVWKVKSVFFRMPGTFALECFARVMTADLPHPLKAATWHAVRYSHIWWGVDDVLKGDVLDNPLVRRAFVDAVPMRRRIVELRLPGWEDLLPTLSEYDIEIFSREAHVMTKRQMLIASITHREDDALPEYLRESFSVEEVCDFTDARGNGILWYLTYRQDQQAIGGYGCPKTARTLMEMGADPFRLNDLGLCWNDVSRHFV